MIRVKPGVEFAVFAPGGLAILAALRTVSKQLGRDLTITSACDGAHSGPDDPHHRGLAFDVRTHDLPDYATKAQVRDAVLRELGSRFFGFLEAAGTSNEHFHVQLAQGQTFSMEDFLAA